MANQDFTVNHLNFSLSGNGAFTFRSPSNIALVKYWGKYGEQLPKNASVSFTLSNCFTETTLYYERITSSGNAGRPGGGFNFEVFLDGKREEGFEPKILKFFQRIEKYIPFLKDYKFKIETHNSFPHSSGIASSASGMSALALCLIEMERLLNLNQATEEYYIQKASFIARLGSGSACRSVQGPLVVWGEHPDIERSSNLYGTKYPYEIHPVFNNYQDTILLVDQGEKQVSSTVGHDLMHNHPFAKQRFAQANSNMKKLISVFKTGNIDAFIEIVESEALSLHAMMMTSMPYFILMKPDTLQIINAVWNYRKATGSKACFTLDAGANVHLLYPETEREQIQQFVKNELSHFCQKGKYIHDFVGTGAGVIND